VRLLGPDADPDNFWQNVKTNLQAGRVRLVFVADHIPTELRRVVEFLNSQMGPAEVLALELKQYVGKSVKSLVPRLIGRTAMAEQKKHPGSPRKWDEPTFFASLEHRHGKQVANTAKQILEWARSRGLRIWWGEGQKDGSFFPMVDCQGEAHWLISVWTYGRLEVQFQFMQSNGPLAPEGACLELLQRLNAVPNVSIPSSAITKRPSIPLRSRTDEVALSEFLQTLSWAVDKIRSG
jgi:hypothetical protein